MENEICALERVDFQTLEEAETAMRDIETTEAGIRIMREKALFVPIRVISIDTRAANILKQTYLSKGGDVAVSRHSADFTKKRTDAIIFATLAQHRAAVCVLRRQPWGLLELAKKLEKELAL